MITDTEQATKTGIRVTGLRKTYGETVALDGLDLEAAPGEVLGIAGPNGAGKSTLIKILAGEVKPDEGEVLIDGIAWTPELGARTIAVVHQEPELFPNLTVAQNLLVGREESRFVMRRPGQVELGLLADLQIAEHAQDQLGLTPLAVQQKTEIARALIHDARVVLFDEPNSALTEEESDELFRRIRLLADTGHVVILVSHRLSELAENSDRVVMIVDGKVSARLSGPDKTKERIARELVVGVDTSSTDQRRASAKQSGSDDNVVLHLRNWTVKGSPIDGVEVVLPAGQVTAFVGVEGSGARELVQSLAGIVAGDGDIVVGQTAGRGGLATAAFVAGNRQDSLFHNLSVGENLVVRLGDEIGAPLGFLNRRAARRLAETGCAELLVKTANVRQPIGDLSGGNQQKVAIGAAMMTKPSLLVLEEPTRGVDVGSKGEIYTQLHEYAAQGHAVAVFCTEDVEVFEAADVVHVVSKGSLSGPIVVSDFNDVEHLAVELAGHKYYE